MRRQAAVMLACMTVQFACIVALFITVLVLKSK